MITGYISLAATTRGLDDVLMGGMRMFSAVGVAGALGMRYLASAKVCFAAPAGGVPGKK